MADSISFSTGGDTPTGAKPYLGIRASQQVQRKLRARRTGFQRKGSMQGRELIL
jgi:hypothetical protein